MEWWELALFFSTCIAGGTGFYFLIIRLIFLFLAVPQRASQDMLFSHLISPKLETSPGYEGRLLLSDPRLLAEIENNLRLASEVWTRELVSFDTQAWESGQYGIYDLPTFLRNQLIEVYDMISIANQIAWLSTELNHRSQNVDATYWGVRANIAQKLHRIKRDLK